jgi:hypothetical protein
MIDTGSHRLQVFMILGVTVGKLESITELFKGTTMPLDFKGIIWKKIGLECNVLFQIVL